MWIHYTSTFVSACCFTLHHEGRFWFSKVQKIARKLNKFWHSKFRFLCTLCKRKCHNKQMEKLIQLEQLGHNLHMQLQKSKNQLAFLTVFFFFSFSLFPQPRFDTGETEVAVCYPRHDMMQLICTRVPITCYKFHRAASAETSALRQWPQL